MSDPSNHIMCEWRVSFRPINIKDLLRLLKAVLEINMQKLSDALENLKE